MFKRNKNAVPKRSAGIATKLWITLMKLPLRRVTGTKARGIGNFLTGFQEHSFGVSGTAAVCIPLIFRSNDAQFNPLTSLTQDI